MAERLLEDLVDFDGFHCLSYSPLKGYTGIQA